MVSRIILTKMDVESNWMHIYVHSGKFRHSPNAIFILNYHKTELSMNILASHFYKKIIIGTFSTCFWGIHVENSDLFMHLEALAAYQWANGNNNEFLTKASKEGPSRFSRYSTRSIYQLLLLFWFVAFYVSLLCMLIGFACLFHMFVSLFAFLFFCLTRNFTIAFLSGANTCS